MKGKVFAMTAMLALSALLSACDSGTTATSTPGASTGTGDKRTIVVSSKNFTEEEILGEIYAIALDAAGIKVSKKLNLGTADIAQAALVRGGASDGIDLYPEYTSTGLRDILKVDTVTDPEKIYEAVKKGYKEKFNITWLDKSPMNDTQAMVTSKEVSEKLGISSLEDLCAKADQVTVAAVAEFKDRPDALPLLQKTYGGCNFKDIKVFEPNLRYKALLDKQVDIAQAFSTDGEIAGNNLVLLADPKGYGLPYNVAPVVRDDVLAMYPNIADTLNKISPLITNEEISALNWKVSGQSMQARDVAKQWLYDKGLLPK
jgi:osmoprotectant transport system substrate-binding protein